MSSAKQMAPGSARDTVVNILLVDDQPAGLLALEGLLDRLGQNLVTARSGNEALQRLLHADFAVILLDVRMPGLDGFETARMIRSRARSANTPIIFLTAAGRDDVSISRGYALGAVDFLTKPIIGEVLRSKVEVFVELAKKNALLAALNQTLTAQTTELAAANHELEAFSYSVSHDLRAPLRAITGFSQLLVEEHGPTLNDDAKGCLARIQGAGQRMEELIDDLLALARVGRTGLQRTHLDLGGLVAEVAAQLTDAEPDRAVETVIAQPVWADADPGLIRLVVENLLSNAFKFTRKVEHARIEFGIGFAHGKRNFFVRDNGAGFDMAQVGRLFQPFQRLHAAADFPGTGIGLAIVQRVIVRHGGTLWADSRPGEGTVFRFTL